MAGWLENSFGDFAKVVYIRKVKETTRPGSCSVQPTNTSDDQDCEITFVAQKASTSDSQRNQGTNHESKQDKFLATNVSTHNKSQHIQILKYDFSERKRTSTLSPVKSNRPEQQSNCQTTNKQDGTNPPKIAKQQSTCFQSNEGANSNVVRQVNTKTSLKFPTPRYWEKQKIRNLGSLTKKDRDVSVFAIASYFFPPKKTRGAHMFFHFGVVDPTLYGNKEELPCICFQQFEADMPLIKNVGDVIKLPLRITIYQNKLQGKTYDDKFPWISFDGRPNAPVVPRYSRGSPPTFTDADKKKVEELKSWAVSVGITQSLSSAHTLAELNGRENLYFNLLCQVVHVDSEEKTLHVWDGTEPSFPGLLSDSSEMFANKTKWGRKVIGKCVKIWIHGCHVKSNYAPGQYIEITNLHFILKEDTANKEPTKIPILSLHDGTPYNCGIKILDDNDVNIQKVTNRMEALSTPPVTDSCDLQKVLATNEQPDGEIDEEIDGNIDLYNIKIVPPMKRRRISEDCAKVTEALKATVNLLDEQAKTRTSTTTCTSNKPSVTHTVNEARTTLSKSNESSADDRDFSQASNSCVDVCFTSNKAVVKPTASDARAAPLKSSATGIPSHQATKLLVDESSTANEVIVKPVASKSTDAPSKNQENSTIGILSSRATQSRVDESCTSNEAINCTKPDVNDHRQAALSNRGDTPSNQGSKSCVDESCTSNGTIVKPTVKENRATPTKKQQSRTSGIPSNQRTKLRVEESSTSNEVIVNPSSSKARVAPSNNKESNRSGIPTNQARESRADESSAPNEVIVKPVSKAGVAPSKNNESNRGSIPSCQPTKLGVGKLCISSEAVARLTIHPSIPFYTMKEIRSGTVPNKFRCRATVRFVLPREPAQFVIYVCSHCRKRYNVEHIKDTVGKPDFSAIERCINANCSALLSLSMQFSFVLQDESDICAVTIFGEVAKKMFPNIEPLKLLTDENTQTSMSRCLARIISNEYSAEYEIRRSTYNNGSKRQTYIVTARNPPELE